MRALIALAGVAAIAGSVVTAQDRQAAGDESRAGAPAARAELKNASGATIGTASLRESPNGVLVEVDLRQAPEGVHAFHVHGVGQCDAPSFESAGDHFAPRGKEHGFLDKAGPHAGDLPNVHVPAGGRLAFELSSVT